MSVWIGEVLVGLDCLLRFRAILTFFPWPEKPYKYILEQTSYEDEEEGLEGVIWVAMFS